jgi:uncharacterized protein (TIRG00374 family)
MKWRLWFGIIVSSVFLYLAFRKMDMNLLWLALGEVDYRYIIPVIFLTYISIGFRSARWLELLKPIKKVSFYSSFLATSIGFMALFLLPARLGDIIRPYLLGSREGFSRSSALGTVVVERLIDVFTVILLLSVVLITIEFSAENETYREKLIIAGYLFLTIFFLILLLLIFIKKSTKLAVRGISLVLSPLPKVFSRKLIDLLQAFAMGVVMIRGVKSWVIFLIYTGLIWFTGAIGIKLITLAFGMDLPSLAPLFILVLIVLGVSIPAAPGYIGTFHAAGLLGLLFFGVQREKALSCAIVIHLSNGIPLVVLGLFLMWLEGIKMKDVKGAKS